MTNSAFGRARITLFTLVVSALALVMAAVFPFSGAVVEASPSLQGSTAVAISPASLELDCGETATVEVRISDVEDLFGVDIKVSYNPAVLEVVDSNATTPGTQIQPGDLPDVSGGQGLIQVNTVDTTGGTVSYAAVRLNPAPAQSGSGVIAKITFKGKATGTSPITLVSAILADQTARAIPATLTNGSASVTCDGSPSTPSTPGPTATPRPGYTPVPGDKPCHYTVQHGDTLYSIARAKGTTVSALLAVNKLYNPDLIYVGQKLLLPGCVDGGPPPPGGHQPPPGGPHYPPSGYCHTHIVKPGETLFSIAYASGDSVEAIAKRNGIVNPHLIFVGQALEICPTGGHPGPGPGQPGPGHPGPGYPPPSKCKFTHIVKPGETLFSIAWGYGLSYHSLAVINNLANPNLIYVGQALCIP